MRRGGIYQRDGHLKLFGSPGQPESCHHAAVAAAEHNDVRSFCCHLSPRWLSHLPSKTSDAGKV